MASQKDKMETDAQRAKSRGFAGYLMDRATGRADFDKKPSPKTAPAAPMGDEDVMKRREREAGLKCGGTVKKYAKGGSIDGVATKGKTRGKMC